VCLLIAGMLMVPASSRETPKIDDTIRSGIHPMTNLSYVLSSTGIKHVKNDGGHMGWKFGDLDKDGYLDIVSVGGRLPAYGEDRLWAYKGKGDGSWQEVSDAWGVTSIHYFSHGGIGLGDVNNVGNLDIAVGAHGPSNYEVFLNGGGWSWTSASEGIHEEDGYDGEFGDVNNDGYADLFVSGFWSGNLTVYINDHNGGWINPVRLATGWTSSMHGSFGDIDADGNLDAVGNGGNGNWVWFGDGNGSWIRSVWPDMPMDLYNGAPSLGDVNGDGLLDLAIPNSQSSKYGPYLYLAKPGRQWENVSGKGIPFDQSVGWVVKFADFDSDGVDELLTGAGRSPAAIWKWDNSRSVWINMNASFPASFGGGRRRG